MDLPEFFGIDLGNHSIKVAQVKRKNDTEAELQRVSIQVTEVNLLVDDSEDGMRKLAAELKQLHKLSGISTTNCVAAVPESPIFSRLITIPKVESDKLTEAVHWEVKPLIPVPLDEVDIAFLEISERKVETQTLVDIYVVAAPKTLTNKYKQLMEFAGLNLIALETESLANARVVKFNNQNQQDFIIVDLGAKSTDIVLARHDVPIFAQTISTGADALTKAISADYGIDLQEAEKYKQAFGIRKDVGEGKIAKSIEPIMQIVVTEIDRTLTYFRQKIGETGATKMYLVGEAAQLPGLTEYFGQHFGLDPVILDPLSALKISGEATKQLGQTPHNGLSIAIGLGLKVN